MSDIYLSITETPAVVTLSQPIIASSVAATVTVGNTVTVALDANSLSALENVTVTVGSSVALAAGSAQVGSVTISNFPSTQTIAGTVTANAFGYDSANSTNRQIPILPYNEAVEGMEPYVVPVQISNTFGAIQTGNPLPISGTVTANVLARSVNNGSDPQFYPIPVIGYDEAIETSNRPVVVPVQLTNNSGTILNEIPISGTVTANNPNGALTTRFGSVTTANTAQITSAVTNTSRKYLLAQNISAGTVTIGIGFSPTTTQGIQLTAGGGLTFDAFCPTGAVYWLGAVTGAAFTILEG